jgi:hypothetical protein
MEPAILGLLVLVLIAVFIRVLAGSADHQRIESHIRERGGRVVSINWAPLGKGWIGEQDDRIYEVVYYDREGNQHMATCKTRMLGGVYFTDDQVAHRRARWADRAADDAAQGKPLIYSLRNAEAGQDEIARLRAENARLQEELERLSRGQ